MLSQQHSTVHRPRAANAVPEDAILDAAYELLLAVGMRRVTMADIARAAGVSRPTLYRRWPDVRAVVGALMTREWGRLADTATGTETTGRARLAAAVARLAGTIREHPLLRKVVEVDPEFLLPYLLRRPGTSTMHQLALLSDAVREGQRDGSVREGDPATLARSVLLSAWAFVLTGPALTADHAGLDAELHVLVDRYLAP